MGPTEPLPLSPVELAVDPSSYVDPNGFVFRHRGAVYRAIYRDAAPLYRGLFDDGTIERLCARHHLVPTTIADVSLSDPRVALVLRHETIEPLSYCVEWCPSMLRDAGLAQLDLALAVLERDLILQDCYPWNVLFRGSEPVVVDVTSIVRADTSLIWPAYEQFQAFFVRPLALARRGKGNVARALLSNHISGVSLEDFRRNVDPGHRVRHPSLEIAHRVDRLLQRRPTLKRRLQQAAARSERRVERRTRERFLKRQRSTLEGMRTSPRAHDVWSAYYEEIDAHVDKDAKVNAVRATLERLRPGSVVDAGCNTGVFSLLAAEAGARVIALDSSEACIERLYAAARQRSLPITPLVADLCAPTPPSGWMASQYPGLVERARSELVLCLGLMHHLHIAGRQSFPRIAALMDALSTRYLVFEFVAEEDPNNDLIGRGRAIRYTLDDVRGALAAHFPSIGVRDSDRPTRRLLVCEKNA
jgi:SAM-dependent methyltransferase